VAVALAIGGVVFANAAKADVSVSVDVAAPEITVADPEEVTVTTEPPEPIYEEPTDLPGPGYVWVGGSWGWTGRDWGWYPGRWLMAPEGRVYVEPYYERVGPNVVYVRGYWGRPDAPHRSYGGERIRFAPVSRPVDYRRGEPPRFERRPGAPPGMRPAGFYEHASGPVRPLPVAHPYREAPHERQPVRPAPERGPVREREVVRPVPERAPAPHAARAAPAPRAAPPREEKRR
jgi:hypothetical protein